MKAEDRKRVIAFLNRDEMEFVDKVGMDALFSTGLKLSRIDIISSFVTSVMRSQISGEGVKSKEELIERIIEGIYREVERRQFPRIKKTMNVHFRELESMQPLEDHETKDLSTAGLRIGCSNGDDLPKVDQMIEITVTNPNDRADEIEAVGKVIWVEKTAAGDSFEVGVSLTYIKNANKVSIDHFLFDAAAV